MLASKREWYTWLHPQYQTLRAPETQKKGWEDFWIWRCVTSRNIIDICLNANSDNISSNINVELTSATPICSPPPEHSPQIHGNFRCRRQWHVYDHRISLGKSQHKCAPRHNWHSHRTRTQISVFLYHPSPTTTFFPRAHYSNLQPQPNGHWSPMWQRLVCHLQKSCSHSP